MKKLLIAVFVVVLAFGGIFIYQYFKFNDHKLHIVICDVGQGDGIFIRTSRGQDIIIDGGPDNSILDCLSKHMPFWDRTIELIIMTHPDADHLTGLIDVIKRYNVMSFNTEEIGKSTLVYQKLVKTLAEKNITKRIVWQNDKFLFKDKMQLEVLWPTHEWVNEHRNDKNLQINNLSVITFLTYGKNKALFTGDAEAVVMEKIAALAGDIDILKVPHHGSKTGLTAEILDMLNPKITAISVGKNNKYGHPTNFILDMLKNFEIKILRTDQGGEIEFVSDGENWSMQ